MFILHISISCRLSDVKFSILCIVSYCIMYCLLFILTYSVLLFPLPRNHYLCRLVLPWTFTTDPILKHRMVNIKITVLIELYNLMNKELNSCYHGNIFQKGASCSGNP